MNIKVLSRDLKQFKRVTRAKVIKITAYDSKVELYANPNRDVEVLRELQGGVNEIGSTIINADVIDLLPVGEVIITDNSINIENICISYNCEDSDLDYTPFVSNEILVNKLENNKLKEILETKYSLAKDFTREVLQNIYLSKNDAVAIDGYRLAKRITNFNLNNDIFIPQEVVKVLNNINGDGYIGRNDISIVFGIGDYKIRFINQDWDYINYRTLIPKENQIIFTVDASTILNILKRANRLKTNLVRFEINNNKLAICVDRFDINFKEILDINCNEELNIAFNIKYLLDLFKIAKGEVTLELKSCVSPVIFKQGEKLDMILPIRVSK